MSIVYEERASDSPYIETIMHGHTLSAGSTLRPAESRWHLVFVRLPGLVQPLVVGPITMAGTTFWGEGAEILWIQLKLGTFLPHLPAKNLLDREIPLPQAASHSFWLDGSAWQFPDYETVDTFVGQLVRKGILVCDPEVQAALQDQQQDVPLRTMRHRFRHSTGLTQSHIRQAERARQAAALLQQGVSILDTVEMAGYFDQPHLTRSLKHWIGYTPAQIIGMQKQPGCIQKLE